MLIRKSTLLSFLNKELKQAKAQAISDGDRRDWNGSTESAYRVSCIEEIISKVSVWPIVIKSSFVGELKGYLSSKELILDDVVKQDDDSYSEDEEVGLWEEIRYTRNLISRLENMKF